MTHVPRLRFIARRRLVQRRRAQVGSSNKRGGWAGIPPPSCLHRVCHLPSAMACFPFRGSRPSRPRQKRHGSVAALRPRSSRSKSRATRTGCSFSRPIRPPIHPSISLILANAQFCGSSSPSMVPGNLAILGPSLAAVPCALCSLQCRGPGGQGGNQTTSINTSLRAWPRHIPEAPSRRRRQLRDSSTIKSFETEQPSTGQKRTRTRNQLPRTLEHSLHRQPTSPTPLH